MRMFSNGEKMAVLVANGFEENHFSEVQKLFHGQGLDIRIVSMESGLVNSWRDDAWGLNFAADKTLNTALAADYDMLFIPGGNRSAQKLKLTAHTQRFIKGFMQSSKPVFAVGDAVSLLMESELVTGLGMSGPDEMKAEAERVGATWSSENFTVDGPLMTAKDFVGADDAQAAALTSFLTAEYVLDQAA